jgi:hypothetical protein
VLAQRVIAVGDAADSLARRPSLRLSANGANANEPAPQRSEAPSVDLATTSLEWGGLNRGRSQATAVALVPPAPSAPEPDDAEWATHSSIALELDLEDEPAAPPSARAQAEASALVQRLLGASLEDAVTMQYNGPLDAKAPTQNLSATVAELASLDRSMESAGLLPSDPFDGAATKVREAPPPVVPAPPNVRMLVVPASLVWIALGLLLVCALLLTYLAAAYLMCGQPQLFDALHLRCVAPAR